MSYQFPAGRGRMVAGQLLPVDHTSSRNYAKVGECLQLGDDLLARKVVQRGLSRSGWPEADLGSRRRGDPTIQRVNRIRRRPRPDSRAEDEVPRQLWVRRGSRRRVTVDSEPCPMDLSRPLSRGHRGLRASLSIRCRGRATQLCLKGQDSPLVPRLGQKRRGTVHANRKLLHRLVKQGFRDTGFKIPAEQTRWCDPRTSPAP